MGVSRMKTLALGVWGGGGGVFIELFALAFSRHQKHKWYNKKLMT